MEPRAREERVWLCLSLKNSSRSARLFSISDVLLGDAVTGLRPTGIHGRLPEAMEAARQAGFGGTLPGLGENYSRSL